MNKLIITDIDGTLVKDGANQINENYFNIIRQLKEKGYLFAAASGRQYASIRRLFAPIAEDMIFVAENGAYVVCREREISSTTMEMSSALELIQDIKNCPGYCAVVSKKDSAYVDNQDEEFLDLLVNGYHNNVKIVPDLRELKEGIIKIALFRHEGISLEKDNFFKQKWAQRLKVVNAGKEWLDFMDSAVDKGQALKNIQEVLNIKKEQTTAFGDNINDIGMLSNAGKSYAVATAREEVKQVAKKVIGSYHDDGVLQVLTELLDSTNKI